MTTSHLLPRALTELANGGSPTIVIGPREPHVRGGAAALLRAAWRGSLPTIALELAGASRRGKPPRRWID